MSKPYRLLLVSLRKPDTADGIFCSNHMIAWALWDELSTFPYVTLDYQDSDAPLTAQGPWDFVLLHSYFGAPIYHQLPALRAQTRHQILTVIEAPLPPNEIDHCFTFLPFNQPHTEYVPCPCLGKLLCWHYSIPKVPGSILLDHTWKDYAGTERDWSDRLYEWLDGMDVTQLRRGGHDEQHTFPNWIKQIPEQGYLGYLAATARFEDFILTHPGSYEHSIIDMAYRGIRVLSPVQNGRPFAPESVVERLKLKTFSGGDELRQILATPPENHTWMHRFCTDMQEVARRIDDYCQRLLV